MTKLPGSPGPKLRDAWSAMEDEARVRFAEHLLGGTSADWLSSLLNEHGLPVSATTIRNYRRALQKGV